MAVTVVAHGAEGIGIAGGTSTSLNLGTCSLITIYIAYQGGTTAPTVADSNTNSYTYKDTVSDFVGLHYLRHAYAYGTNIGGSGFTFTITADSNAAVSISWQSWSGTQTSSDPFVQKSDNVRSASFVSCGSLTGVTVGNALAAGLFSFTESVGASIDSGFATPDFVPYLAGAYYSGAGSTKVASGTTSAPQWDVSTSQTVMFGMQVEFAAAGGGGGVTVQRLPAQGVGYRSRKSHKYERRKSGLYVPSWLKAA